jgi:hypothetical protein
MSRDPLEVEAAGRLLAALDIYTSAFEEMVASDMASGVYREVNDCLEQIREAASMNSRELLFNTVQLVLAHSNFTTRLWQRQVGRQQPGSSLVSEVEIEALRHDHQRAAKRLRERCQNLLAKAVPPNGADSKAPPPAQ